MAPKKRVKTKKSKKKKPTKPTLRLGFKNKKFLEAALHHPSYRNENPTQYKLEDFDRLEFLGDSILNLVVCKKLYQAFPNANEGVLSRMRSTLVSKKILSKVAKDLKIPSHIKLGRGLKKQTNLSKSKIVSDCFESIIAALYFDKGYDRAERFILKHLKNYFDLKRLTRLDPNPKSTLQEIVLKEWRKLPQYKNVTSPKGTTTTISIHTRLKAKAQGKTRKESEEKAARLLIQKVRQRSSTRGKRVSSGRISRRKT